MATITTTYPHGPLAVELVPDTCAGSNLRRAVLAELGAFPWAQVRRLVAARAGHTCEVCGGIGPRHPVEVHERWEYLSDTERHVQRLAGFVALCPKCHTATHYGLAQLREQRGELPAGSTRAHLAAVNGWDEATVRHHLEHAFAVQRERNTHQWWWDLRVLEEYGFADWARLFAPDERPTPDYDFAQWHTSTDPKGQ